MSLLAMMHPQQGASHPAQHGRRIALTRTLKLPVRVLQAAGDSSAAARDSAALLVWPGATDEPPEGPAGFDVFDDGRVLVADPLQKRLAMFDPQGKFERSWEIGFAADSVRVTKDGSVLVREQTTGGLRAYDREGKIRAGALPTVPALPTALVQPGGRAGQLVSGVGQVTSYRGFDVHYDQPGSALLSLEPLAIDPDRGTYVALEVSAPATDGEAINLNKMIRQYAVQGTLISETSAIPLDYYVLPTDELRVRKGVVYQLMTTRNEVQIHEWDTNAN